MNCVGYLYLGIRVKGLMSVISAHPMIKDATAASFDPEDEVSAWSDPRGRATPCPTPRTRFLPRPTPSRGLQLQGQGFCLVRPQGVGSDSEDEVSASSDSKAWVLTPPTPRRGLRLVRSCGEDSASSAPQGSDFVSPGPRGEISALPAL